MKVLDKSIDEDWSLIITKRDGVAGKTGLDWLAHRQKNEELQMRREPYQFLNKCDQRLQIFLNRQMELVFVLQVDGY